MNAVLVMDKLTVIPFNLQHFRLQATPSSGYFITNCETICKSQSATKKLPDNNDYSSCLPPLQHLFVLPWMWAFILPKWIGWVHIFLLFFLQESNPGISDRSGMNERRCLLEVEIYRKRHMAPSTASLSDQPLKEWTEWSYFFSFVETHAVRNPSQLAMSQLLALFCKAPYDHCVIWSFFLVAFK